MEPRLHNAQEISRRSQLHNAHKDANVGIISSYRGKFQILHDSQEEFRAERSTSRQIQLLIATLEDARLTNQGIYILYIDFKNAFGFIDHPKLLAIMKDLGYPTDSINLIENIYS